MFNQKYKQKAWHGISYQKVKEKLNYNNPQPKLTSFTLSKVCCTSQTSLVSNITSCLHQSLQALSWQPFLNQILQQANFTTIIKIFPPCSSYFHTHTKPFFHGTPSKLCRTWVWPLKFDNFTHYWCNLTNF